MVVTAYPVKELTPSFTVKHITYEDGNVVRYIAGYVCWKVRLKIKQTCPPIYVLIWIEQKDVASASVNWMDAVDGGGLVHIKERTYILFCTTKE